MKQSEYLIFQITKKKNIIYFNQQKKLTESTNTFFFNYIFIDLCVVLHLILVVWKLVYLENPDFFQKKKKTHSNLLENN